MIHSKTYKTAKLIFESGKKAFISCCHVESYLHGANLHFGRSYSLKYWCSKWTAVSSSYFSTMVC